jgi:hypothetical protein
VYGGPTLFGVFEQQLVELRAIYLKGVLIVSGLEALSPDLRHPRIESVIKEDAPSALVFTPFVNGTIFLDEPVLSHDLAQAKMKVEQFKRGRLKRFADVWAGKTGFVEHRYVHTFFGENGCQR